MAVAVYFICCDSVRADPANPVRVNILGLLSQFRSQTSPPFPHVRPVLTVYLVLSEPDPRMDLTVQVVRADTGAVVCRMPSKPVRIGGGRDQRVGIRLNILDCPFPVAGLYWVECWSAGVRLARQRLYAVK